MPQSYYKKKKTLIISKKTIILTAIAIILVIAHITVPSKQLMVSSISYYVKSDINDESPFVSATDKDVSKMFYTYNTIDIFKHYFYSTAHIHNRYHTKDKIACIGVLGIVIPIVDWNEYIVKNGPVKRHYYRGGKKNPQYTPIIGNKDYETGRLPNK